MAGPTRNWPAEPPAMPNICVAPIRVAARDGREVGGGDVDGADQREDAAGALQEAADAGERRIAGREQQRADADERGAERHDLARTELVHRDAGDQAERRVAVVEEPDQRGEADGRQAEGARSAAASSPPAPTASRTGRSR